MDADQYCREVEVYLCRKNDGHLIRIVGPSFELVTSWAVRGIPLKVTCRGIDRHFERYYAKGPRRRPVRIDFCEADVLDVFDEWRRTVGIGSVDTVGAKQKARESLAQHVERIIARLTARRGGGSATAIDDAIGRIVRELDRSRAVAKTLRGDARVVFLERLQALDRELIETARNSVDEHTLATIDRECEEELAAFRDRMTETAYQQAKSLARDRLLRDQFGLPTVTF